MSHEYVTCCYNTVAAPSSSPSRAHFMGAFPTAGRPFLSRANVGLSFTSLFLVFSFLITMCAYRTLEEGQFLSSAGPKVPRSQR